MKKKILMLSLILICIAAISILSLIKISDISVKGNVHYTAEELENLLLPGSLDRHVLISFIKDKLGIKKRLPFIQDYKFEWHSPTKMEIIVYEKSIVAAINYMNVYMYFDKDGIVVESSHEKIEGVPIFEGLEISNIVLYQKLPLKDEQVFKKLISLSHSLTHHKLQAKKIVLHSGDKANIFIADIEVYFGTLDNIEEKSADLSDILKELIVYKGVLYMHEHHIGGEQLGYTFQKKP